MSRMMLVPMSQANVEALIALKQRPEETLDAVVGQIIAETKSVRSIGEATSTPTPIKDRSRAQRYTVRLLGEEWPASSAKEVLVSVLRRLDKTQPSLLPRLSEERGRSRRLVARRREQLYAPDRGDLAEKHAESLGNSWWVSTNHARRDIDRWLNRICELAEMHYGRDLVVTPSLG